VSGHHLGEQSIHFLASVGAHAMTGWCRTTYLYSVYTVFLAQISPNSRSYTWFWLHLNNGSLKPCSSSFARADQHMHSNNHRYSHTQIATRLRSSSLARANQHMHSNNHRYSHTQIATRLRSSSLACANQHKHSNNHRYSHTQIATRLRSSSLARADQPSTNAHKYSHLLT
jgi:hypothetical protein